MIVSYTLDPNAPITPEEIAEAKALEDRPIVFDEDCPPITPEMAKKFYHPGEDREGDMVGILVQVTPATLETAKTFGKNYVAKMGELLDEAVSSYSKQLQQA